MQQVEPLTVPVQDLPGLLNVSARTIQTLLTTGRLPSVQVGRRRLVLLSDLKEFLEARRVQASA